MESIGHTNFCHHRFDVNDFVIDPAGPIDDQRADTRVCQLRRSLGRSEPVPSTHLKIFSIRQRFV